MDTPFFAMKQRKKQMKGYLFAAGMSKRNIWSFGKLDKKCQHGKKIFSVIFHKNTW